MLMLAESGALRWRTAPSQRPGTQGKNGAACFRSWRYTARSVLEAETVYRRMSIQYPTRIPRLARLRDQEDALFPFPSSNSAVYMAFDHFHIYQEDLNIILTRGV